MFKQNKSAPESGISGSLDKLTLFVPEKHRVHLCTYLWEESLLWLCEIANERQKYSCSTWTEVCVEYGVITSFLEQELEAKIHTWDEVWTTSTSETKLDSSKMPLSAWWSHFLLIDTSWYNSISHASGCLVVHGKESNTTENPVYERMRASGRFKLQLFWTEFLNTHTAILFF